MEKTPNMYLERYSKFFVYISWAIFY